MAHATRGRRSGTYEIQELVGVDLDLLSLTVRHAGAYQPKVFRLNVPPTPAARQLLQAMAESIKVGENGDGDSAWESVATVANSVRWSQIMLAELKAAGVDDFTSPAINVPLLPGAAHLSALIIKRALMVSGVSVGSAWSSRTAAPATTGAAIEVPES